MTNIREEMKTRIKKLEKKTKKELAIKVIELEENEDLKIYEEMADFINFLADSNNQESFPTFKIDNFLPVLNYHVEKIETKTNKEFDIEFFMHCFVYTQGHITPPKRYDALIDEYSELYEELCNSWYFTIKFIEDYLLSITNSYRFTHEKIVNDYIPDEIIEEFDINEL